MGNELTEEEKEALLKTVRFALNVVRMALMTFMTEEKETDVLYSAWGKLGGDLEEIKKEFGEGEMQ